MPVVRVEVLAGRSLARKRELARVVTDAVGGKLHLDHDDAGRR